MNFLYDFLIRCYALFLHLAALFHPKARLWVSGRRNWRARYRAGWQKKGRVLWIHAASLGEFEQGRPVLESFRMQFPAWQVVLTFYSPSGYEIRKNYPHADFIGYLPLDTRRNARDFLDLVQPDAALFVKYEFWANFLFELKQRNTPTLLISALFRPGQPFFRPYGVFWRRMLACFSHIFVQDEPSAALLRKTGFRNTTVAGDTRVDRVLKIAENAPQNGITEAFAAGRPLVIAGSTWEADERIIAAALEQLRDVKMVIAPHEPSERQLSRLIQHLKRPCIRYSRYNTTPGDEQATVLLIDNIGLLNTLYRYGRVAYIGGGFGKGIHNTLEPAAFGLPILFGPNFEKFEEARQFVARGGAFPVRNAAELAARMVQFGDPEFYRKASAAVLTYLEENRGATERILQYMAEQKDWLPEERYFSG